MPSFVEGRRFPLSGHPAHALLIEDRSRLSDFLGDLP